MILLIDNYDSFTYNLYQLLAMHDKEVKVVRNDKITLNQIVRLNPAGIVLSPGPGRPESAGICIELVKQFSGKIPLLGVCLGHQAIAAAFGAKVIASPHITHGKSSLIFHHRKDIFQSLSLPFEAGRYHSLTIDKTSLPACLSISAQCVEGEIMALNHKTHPSFGLQFHPESIMTPKGAQLIKNFTLLCNHMEQCA